MKIVVNDVAVKRDSGGVFSILSDLYSTAVKDIENQWVFILGSKLFDETDNVKIIVRQDLQINYFKRVMFDFLSGARFINNMNPDVVISMQNTAILGVNTKQYVYVHTPLPFRNDIKFSFFKANQKKLAFYQKIVGNVIKLNLKLSRNISTIVQTHWMADELVGRKLVTDDKVVILPPSMDEIQMDDLSDGDTGVANGDYIYPSTPLFYKHHDTAVQALAAVENNDKKLHLTITVEDYQNLYGNSKVGSEVVFEDRKPRDWVFSSLNNGAILVFPSEMETFGLPLMEAKKMNARIIAKDHPVLREAVSDYNQAIFFNNETELAEIFNRINEKQVVFTDVKFEDNKNYKKLSPGFKSFIESELR